MNWLAREIGNSVRGAACRPASALSLMLALLLLTTASGCALFAPRQIGVKRISLKDKTVLGVQGYLIDHLSDRTRQTLREADLEKLYCRSQIEATQALHDDAIADPSPDKLFALAEIHSRIAYAMGRMRHQEALGHHYLATGYAFHFLIANSSDGSKSRIKGEVEKGVTAQSHGTSPWETAMVQPQDVYDPRFIQACDLYNKNLAHLVSAIPQNTWKTPAKRGGEAITLSLQSRHPDLTTGKIAKLIPCNELVVTGMRTHHRSYGLGVPLLLEAKGKQASTFQSIHVAQSALAGTAFLRFGDSLEALRRGPIPPIEIEDPIREPVVQVQGRKIPLEIDTTTVLAASLARSGLEGLDYSAYLFGNSISDRFGLYLLEPYQPGKIPVVLVHGLLSSPITWAPVVNDLMADPDFREKYQIWAYFYPTALPFLLPAADLRDKLLVVRNQLDPDQKDTALENMVLVGHSMGGLIARMLTTDSGNDYWRAIANKPFDEVEFSDPQIKRELHRLFFFEKHPLVTRAVFIATPFGGSNISPSPVGRLAASIPSLPPQMREIAGTLANLDPNLNKRLAAGHVPTSVELLNPKSPVLATLNRSRPNGIHWHAIAGKENACFGPLYRALLEINKEDTGDGVVGLESALLVEAESKLVVPAGHTTAHQHPLAVREIRRILREHAALASGQPAPSSTATASSRTSAAKPTGFAAKPAD